MKVIIKSVQYGPSTLVISCTDGKQITICLYGSSVEVQRNLAAFAEKVMRMIDQTLIVIANWKQRTLQIGETIFKKPDSEEVTEITFTLPSTT